LFEATPPPPAGERDADDALKTVVPQVDLETVPFNQAIEKIRKWSAVPIVVHGRELAAEGFDTNSTVTFRARNVTLGRLLSGLLAALPAQPPKNVYANRHANLGESGARGRPAGGPPCRPIPDPGAGAGNFSGDTALNVFDADAAVRDKGASMRRLLCPPGLVPCVSCA
jgi:hypothetical protein